MSCKKCNTLSGKCGCKDTAYTTIIPPSCDTSCPPQCSEVISARCVVMPDGISEIGSEPNDTVEEIVQRLILLVNNPECLGVETDCPCSPLFQTNDVDNDSQSVLNNTESYGMRLTDNGAGVVLYEAVVNENQAVYVDITYGNDTTAEKYNLVRPYATLAAAYSAATTGDVIVFNSGIYVIGQFVITKSDVDFFSKPGVIFRNSGFTVSTSVNWRFYGSAIFDGVGSIPLNLSGTGGTYDVYFEFDKIDGSMNQAIYVRDSSAVSLNLLVNGNSIKSTSNNDTHLVRLDNSNNIKATINIADIISGTQRYIVRLGGFNIVTPMVGFITINCPIIENTGSRINRACVSLDGVLTSALGGNYKIVINSTVIRQTNSIVPDPTGPEDTLSACVFVDGGDNIYINGDLEGNYCLGVANRGAGGASSAGLPWGTIVFNGNVSSRVECVSSCVKLNNGNGWPSLIFKNGLLITEGRGTSACAVVDRPSVWNITNGGVNGKLQFINCRLYNKNLLSDTNATCIVSSGNNPSKTFLYDCLLYVDNTTSDCIVSSNVTENVGMVNVRSNENIAANVSDIYTGFTNTSTLEIPNY